MDPVAVAARVLLIVGCSGAALLPSSLEPADSFIAARPRPVAVTALAGPLPAATASPSATTEESTPFVVSSQLGFEDGSQPVREVVPQPTPLDLRFNQAERVPQSPVRVRIPSQSIDAQVVPVGITPTGEMEAPSGYDEVGWYRYGARPGEPGRAVLAGHLDSRDGPAVFFQLGWLQPGDTIEVHFEDGAETRVFAVRELAQYPVDGAPLGDIFGHVDHPELVLITCAGQFEGPEAGYSERVIVYADAVSAAT